MGGNNDKIRAHYEDYSAREGEGNRAGSSRAASLEFHYTKKALGEHIRCGDRVLEVGCGTGYYGMHFADKCAEYVGIDLFPAHVELFERKIREKGLSNVSCRVGDATRLDGIGDESFDVVCCLGPMYHLPPDARELAFAECARVCKPGGIAAFAFINKIGVYAGACAHDKGRENYPNKTANEYVLRRGVDDLRPDTFFFSMPEKCRAAPRATASRKSASLGRTLSSP